jgi:hypothetical protein
MRPKFSIWSDYGASAQKHWMSAANRGTPASIGPKIFLAAVVVVAAVIGISGIYPQVIDEAWVQNAAGTHLSKISSPTADATPKPPGIVATISLPPHRALTKGRATVSSPGPAPAPELSQLRMSVPVELPADTATPLALAAIPDAEAKAGSCGCPRSQTGRQAEGRRGKEKGRAGRAPPTQRGRTFRRIPPGTHQAEPEQRGKGRAAIDAVVTRDIPPLLDEPLRFQRRGSRAAGHCRLPQPWRCPQAAAPRVGSSRTQQIPPACRGSTCPPQCGCLSAARSHSRGALPSRSISLYAGGEASTPAPRGSLGAWGEVIDQNRRLKDGWAGRRRGDLARPKPLAGSVHDGPAPKADAYLTRCTVIPCGLCSLVGALNDDQIRACQPHRRAKSASIPA